MFIDDIHFLTKWAGGLLPRSIITILLNMNPLKKITYQVIKNLDRKQSLGGDKVQGNFYELLNNANFGFDCRDISQNKSLHLIYKENAEIEFTNKYEDYKSENCFLLMEAKIKNVQNKYDYVENLPEDEQAFEGSRRKQKLRR